MADVCNRTTIQYLQSVNTPDYSPAQWAIYTDSATITTNRALVASVPQYYLKLVGDVLTEMDAGEKAAADVARAAADVAARRADATSRTTIPDPEGISLRALLEVLNKRDNYIINRLSEIQDTLVAIRDQTFGTQARQNILPGFPLATNTRPLGQARTAYEDEVATGDHDG